MKIGTALPLAFFCLAAALAPATLSGGARGSSAAPLEVRSQWHWPASIDPEPAVAALAAQHARALAAVNMHQAGFEILRRGLFLGERPWFPFGRSALSADKARLVNFGRAGLFIALVDAKDTLTSATDTLTSATDTLSSAVLFGPQAPEELLETAAFSPTGGLFQRTHEFRAFSDALRAQRGALFTGEADAIETATLLVWAGGLQCLASLQGLAHPAAGFACDPSEERRTRPRRSQNIPAPEGPPLAHRCVAVGSRRLGGLEVFQAPSGSASPEARCYFQRTLADERFESGALESRLACVDPLSKGLLFPALAEAQAVFPGSEAGTWLAYEGRYDPPRLTRVSLGGPEGPTFLPPGAPVGLPGEARPAPMPRLPEGFDGVYACQRGEAKDGIGASGEEGVPGPQREWLFVESDLFEGRRALAPDDDRAYRVTVGAGDALAIEALDWNEVALRATALDALPRFGCLLAPALDAKCGLKILRQAGQMAQEILAGAWDETLVAPVRWNALGLTVSALAEVQARLPQWSLHAETASLQGFFQKELEALAAQEPRAAGLPTTPWWRQDTPLLPRQRALPLALSQHPAPGQGAAVPLAEARAGLMRTLGLPASLWAQLPAARRRPEPGRASESKAPGTGDDATEEETEDTTE